MFFSSIGIGFCLTSMHASSISIGYFDAGNCFFLRSFLLHLAIISFFLYNGMLSLIGVGGGEEGSPKGRAA